MNTIRLIFFSVAVFSLDTSTSHSDISLSNNNRTMNTSSFENRVVIANVGFSRGCHYWEVTIDRYEGNYLLGKTILAKKNIIGMDFFSSHDNMLIL